MLIWYPTGGLGGDERERGAHRRDGGADELAAHDVKNVVGPPAVRARHARLLEGAEHVLDRARLEQRQKRQICFLHICCAASKIDDDDFI